jgi:hypothetical protein
MPHYSQSVITAKRGINHVRASVEGAGCLFVKIDHDNDLGIDALIELIQDGNPLNQQIAVQIKSGQSYFDAENGECNFPIGTHREYWSKHPLPVYGIVYVPTHTTAHWINIKRYISSNPTASSVRYQASEANRFDEDAFRKIFLPGISRQVPLLTRDEAFRLLQSSKLDEAYLGIMVLFRRYPNDFKVWDEFVRFIRERATLEIPPVLVYFIAHIPWHGDIIHTGEAISPLTREHGEKLLTKFGVYEVVKLLSLIDPETSISRGSIGQSVEAIISSLPKREWLLQKIVDTDDLDLFIRECAALILAVNGDKGAESALSKLAKSGSWHAGKLLAHMKERGSVNPYA